MSGLGKRLSKQRWDIQRFGMSPAKLWRRISNRDEPKTLCICLPKAGTHLLERALCLHPLLYRKLVRTVNDDNVGDLESFRRLMESLRPGQVLLSHLDYSSERQAIADASGVKRIFLIRDPRDVVVSQMFYVSRTKSHRFHAAMNARADTRKRLLLIIEGDEAIGMQSIRERYENYAGWLNNGCLVVRFEDLIGPAGGGESDAQLRTLGSIYGHLGLEVDAEQLRSLADGVFSSSSPTFRRGATGGWRKYFDAEIESTFDSVAVGVLERFGYDAQSD